MVNNEHASIMTTWKAVYHYNLSDVQSLIKYYKFTLDTNSTLSSINCWVLNIELF